MIFRLHAWRFCFSVVDPIEFSFPLPENTFRGAFGHVFRKLVCHPSCHDAKTCERSADCDYARMFEPRLTGGPSGLSDLPRPFVFRAGRIAGKTYHPGNAFTIDIHVFDLRNPAFAIFSTAMAQLESEGLGPKRSRVRLASVHALSERDKPAEALVLGRNVVAKQLRPIELPLTADRDNCTRIEVRFLTPTEIKDAAPGTVPTFSSLFGRVRDRIANLSAFYGDGPLALDFRALGGRAREVRLVNHHLTEVAAERRSSRTGQRHPLGGFIGNVVYEGDLAPFIPWLRAAYWTGVGRQTVWGKGVVEVSTALDTIGLTT